METKQVIKFSELDLFQYTNIEKDVNYLNSGITLYHLPITTTPNNINDLVSVYTLDNTYVFTYCICDDKKVVYFSKPTNIGIFISFIEEFLEKYNNIRINCDFDQELNIALVDLDKLHKNEEGADLKFHESNFQVTDTKETANNDCPYKVMYTEQIVGRILESGSELNNYHPKMLIVELGSACDKLRKGDVVLVKDYVVLPDNIHTRFFKSDINIMMK